MSILVNRSTSAFLRLSHANKYPNDFLFKQNTDTVLRPTSSHPLATNDAVMKIESKLPDVLLNFEHEEGCIPPESFSTADAQNFLLHSDSNLRPPSRHGNSVKPDGTNIGNNAETESEETDNGSHSGFSSFVSAEKSSNKQSKKRKRAKSGRASKNRHGNSSKGKRQSSSNAKSGTTSSKGNSNLGTSSVKVKDLVNGVAGLGILDSAICKPVILHKPSSQERKNNTLSENIRRRENLDVNRSVNSKSANASTKNLSNGLTAKSVTLPQMSNNFMVKSDPVLRLSVGSEPLNNSRTYVQQIQKMHNNHSEEITRITKIFLSDKHSGMVKDCGMEVPMAPPATPTPEQLRKVEYVPSMNDIRSQRAVKVKLQVLEREAQKKSARRREEVAKIEKQNMKEREKELRVQQRQEIYALNKVMTELENSRFKEFCVKKDESVPGTTTTKIMSQTLPSFDKLLQKHILQRQT